MLTDAVAQVLADAAAQVLAFVADQDVHKVLVTDAEKRIPIKHNLHFQLLNNFCFLPLIFLINIIKSRIYH